SFLSMAHLPSPLPLHDLSTIISHSIVDSCAIVFNALLLAAVLLRSPKTLKSYTVLLVNSIIMDLVSTTSMLLAMTRAIPARHVLAYVYDGPCVYISGYFCHCMHTLSMATISQSLFLIASSFGYRLYVLGRPAPSSNTIIFICMLISVPNIVILRLIRPEYKLDDYVLEGESACISLYIIYHIFEGHVSIFNFFTMFTILAMTQPIGPTLVAIFIVRRKVLAKIVAHTAQMSDRTAKMHSSLTRVLTLQSLLPIFFSGAVVSYGVCQFDLMCSPVQEHFIMESVSFMPMVAPLITLYCVKPYKE
ncbi:hypothetical protein PFISCL1PPCAC_14038, partial [Pristionchus fissidentatus]